MADVPVILASASPRRLALLGRLGIDPRVQPAHVDETPQPGEQPRAQVARLAAAKAAAVDAPQGALVVAADTVVVLDGAVLGKPASAAGAVAVLGALSGRDHLVLTGVHLRRDGREAAAVAATTVWFRALSDREIAAYAATGEPMDKAGAYGIQGAGGAFVDRIVGSDSNVVGLPLADVVRLAARLGVTVLPDGAVVADTPGPESSGPARPAR